MNELIKLINLHFANATSSQEGMIEFWLINLFVFVLACGFSYLGWKVIKEAIILPYKKWKERKEQNSKKTERKSPSWN